MPRSHEELARFRGDDKAYAEGWDRIFGKKKCDCHLKFQTVCDICQNWDENIKDKNETTTTESPTDNTSGVELRHPDKDVDSVCSEHADERQTVLRQIERSCGIS